MKKRSTSKVLAFFLTLALLLGMVVNTTSAKVAPVETTQELEKVEPAVLEAVSTKGSSDFVVEMAEHADLKAAYGIKDWSERGWYVYNTLKEVADRTQKPILLLLDQKGIKYQSFFAGNEIAVTAGDMAALSQIAALDSVEHIRYPKTAYIDPIPTLSQDLLYFTVQSLDWGITDTNADDFWATYGLQGDGIVVANIDTGVQWDHPALDQAFKCGTNPSNPACWADPSNICGGSACDNNGHGTHTMGTMVGDDDPTLTYQVGMAPNAQWIACKGCESNSCSDTALNACADWIIAPNSNPDNRPNVVNNSWGGDGGDDWYLAKVQAWRAAGIFPAFSAGNSGPTCSSLGSPGDYQESFASAAHSSSRTIASFSSRGPGYFGHDPYTKPNISAPGDYICSSVPGGGWSCGYSGTSMASPHSAGAVALLWSCNSSLIGNMDATFEVLQNTADTPPTGTCGAPADGEGNYTYGYGYLNVLAAGQQVCSAGTITGTVTSGSSPVEGATVTADNGEGVVIDTLTGADGVYTLNAPAGTYTVTATKYGYDSDVETGVEVVEGEEVTINFTINPLSSTTVSGVVYDAGVEGLGSHGYPLYASIHISAPGFDKTIYSDPITGEYSIELVSETEHTFEVNSVISGYEPLIETVTPTTDAMIHDIGLEVDGNVCAAPGYIGSGVNEGFESGTLPYGWVNYDYLGNGQVWRFDDPGGRGNLTPGGNGGFAIVDSDYYGYGGSQDTGLRTPVMDFSGETSVTLDFDTAYNYYSGDSATVRVSADNGATWTIVWSQAADFVGHVTLDISAQAAGQANVIIEFKYVGSWAWYWEVDDVLITPMNCELASGGAVAGFVSDANTGNPLIGADVYSDTVATQSFALEGDPENAGFYWVFQPTDTDPQDVVFTASKDLYADESAIVSVVQDAVTQQDFALGTGELTFDPTEFEFTMAMGDAPATDTLTIGNIGTSAAAFELLEIDGGFQPLEAAYIGKLPSYQYSPEKDLPGLDKSKSIPTGRQIISTNSNTPLDLLISEGFENEFLPTDWTRFITNPSYTWSQSSSYAYEGTYGAYVPWNYGQDEWLLTPELALAEGTLSFYSEGSVYWCRDTYDNCDLNIWLVVGDVGGGDDIFVKNVEGDWSGNWVWTQTSINLNSYLPGVPVRIGFQYIGDDGADVGIDSVTLDGIEGLDVPWLSEDPVSGTVPADGTVEVTITVDPSGLGQPGDYAAALKVKHDTPYTYPNIPVILHLIAPEDFGTINGTVYGLEACDINPAPLEGATVNFKQDDVIVYTTTTLANGYYSYSMPEGVYDIEVLADGFVGQTVTGIVVIGGSTVTQNFELRLLAPCLMAVPPELEKTLVVDQIGTRTLTIINTGTVDADIELIEIDQTPGVQAQISIPAFTGQLPTDGKVASIGPAPQVGNAAAMSDVKVDLGGILSTAPAFAMDIYPGEKLVYIPDTSVPGTWNIIGSIAGMSFFAGDFVGGDFSTMYVVNYDNNGLYAVNTATGAYTQIGTTTPPSGTTFSGLTGAPDGTMYGLATSCSTSYLVTVDVTTGATTVIGSLSGVGCGIDLAFNTNDGMIYVVDLLTDSLFRVNPETAAATLVGSTGINANYAQGMDFEEESGILYWAAYNGNTSTGELRVLDMSTGASTLIGSFPGGAETDCLAFPTGGISDVPWLSEDPVAGTVPAGGSLPITVTFDATGLSVGDYFAGLRIRPSGAPRFDVPVTLHVVDNLKIYMPLITKK